MRSPRVSTSRRHHYLPICARQKLRSGGPDRLCAIVALSTVLSPACECDGAAAIQDGRVVESNKSKRPTALLLVQATDANRNNENNAPGGHYTERIRNDFPLVRRSVFRRAKKPGKLSFSFFFNLQYFELNPCTR